MMRQLLHSGIFNAFGPGRRWPRLMNAFAALLLVAQLGFLVHQNEHHLNLDVMGSDDCAMCQFGTSLSAGPKAEILAVPPTRVVVDIVRLPIDATPRRIVATAAFRSRAPPLSPLV